MPEDGQFKTGLGKAVLESGERPISVGYALNSKAEAADCDVDGMNLATAELRRRAQELEHRLKNVLSNVLSLIARARRDATTDATVLDTLSSRVNALAAAQLEFARSDFHTFELCSMTSSALSDVYGHDRVSLRGAALNLNGRAAAVLDGVFHELATNAAKYGAFSRDEGRVVLNWSGQCESGQDFVVLRWVETGGPRMPGKRSVGVGNQLISSMITGDLSGAIERNWRDDGLTVKISLPLAAIGAWADGDDAHAV